MNFEEKKCDLMRFYKWTLLLNFDAHETISSFLVNFFKRHGRYLKTQVERTCMHSVEGHSEQFEHHALPFIYYVLIPVVSICIIVKLF